MKRLVLTLILIGLPNLGFSKVVPTGITQDQIKAVSEKFTGLLSLHSSNSPFALGEDLEFEITTIYQDLKLNKIDKIGTISSKKILEPIFSIRKGLYWNLDMSFSFVLPVESQLISGYSFNLSHSSKTGSFFIKPEIFISNYNLNDTLNINSSGLSLVVFNKIGFLYFGLGGRMEFVNGKYEEKSLEISTMAPNASSEADFVLSSAIAKVVFKSSISKLTLTYSFADDQKSEAALSLGFRL